MKDKAYSWFDVATKFVDVCYSCSSQNITIKKSDGRNPRGDINICGDCKSEDVGSIPPDEVL